MVKSVFGGASLPVYFGTTESQTELLSVLLANGVTTIDTARIYSGSEAAIGQLAQRTEFTIDTKLPGGFVSGSTTRDAAASDAKASLKTVDIKQFDILYLHAPDPTIPIEETLEGVNEAYKAGVFRRFGLSNFSAEDVQKVYDIAKAKNYVLPSVYQGNYSPVARHLETLLFPTLRKLGLVFYAYSPIAGGFLTKTAAEIEAGAGRFGPDALGGMYRALYNKPSLTLALDTWGDAAEKEGVSKAELAYRWVAYHSALTEEEDAVIFGASSLKQAEQTAQALKKGKLSQEAVQKIQEVWEAVKEDAPIDNYASTRETAK